jgi:DNA-binding NarL/FixJ family response regulator
MAKKNETIQVMIIDDHPVVRMGMKKIIEMEKDMRVCGEAADANKAINLIVKMKKKPDIVIVDISLEGEISGIDLIKAIKSRYSNIKTIVLSMYDETMYAERAIRAGARGYVPKKEASATIVNALRTIMKGEIYLSDSISRTIIGKLLHGSSDVIGTSVDALTNREIQVFELIGNGYGTSEIAKKLNLSINTIESHKRNIKEKLGLRNGAELTKTAIQWVLAYK